MADRTVTLTEQEWAHVIALLTVRGESGSNLARVYADAINDQVKQGSTPVREVCGFDPDELHAFVAESKAPEECVCGRLRTSCFHDVKK